MRGIVSKFLNRQAAENKKQKKKLKKEWKQLSSIERTKLRKSA